MYLSGLQFISGRESEMNNKHKKYNSLIILFIGIIILIFVIVGVIVSLRTKDSEIKKKSEQETSIKETVENGITYQYKYTDGYTAMIAVDKTEVNQENAQQIQGKQLHEGIPKNCMTYTDGDNPKGYGLIIYMLEPVVDEENVEYIEYLLENAVGNVNCDLNYNISREYLVKSVPYTITPDKQEDIYLGFYVELGEYLSSYKQKNVSAITDSVENSRLKITVTYTDGSKKVRYIGFKVDSIYNNNRFNLFEYNN